MTKKYKTSHDFRLTGRPCADNGRGTMHIVRYETQIVIWRSLAALPMRKHNDHREIVSEHSYLLTEEEGLDRRAIHHHLASHNPLELSCGVVSSRGLQA
eukprot:8349830-Pyramimonas_sp.AAC.1